MVVNRFLSSRVELVPTLGAGDSYVAVVARYPNPLVTLRTVEEAVVPMLADLVGEAAERTDQDEPESLKTAVQRDLPVDIMGE